MQPDEPNDEERLEELPEDNGTPFQPAEPELDDTARNDDGDVVTQRIDDTHPDTDTDLQDEDIYENGEADAAEFTEPNAGNAVVGYTPPAKQDDDDDDEAEEE